MKSGWKTSEFWFTAAAQIVGLLAAGGFFVPDSVWAKIIGFAGMILATMGYTYGRSIVKTGVIEDGDSE
jgi:hypothetical protein